MLKILIESGASIAINLTSFLMFLFVLMFIIFRKVYVGSWHGKAAIGPSFDKKILLLWFSLKVGQENAYLTGKFI